MNQIILSQIPMPPSENDSYWAKAFLCKKTHKWRAHFVPSTKLTRYQKTEFIEWQYRSNLAIGQARIACKDWLLAGKMIRIDCFMAFPQNKMWTLKNTVKRMDTKNRLKPLHDCLADALKIDDSFFWGGYDEKIETDTKIPWCFVVLKPFKPRRVNQLPKDLEGYC